MFPSKFFRCHITTLTWQLMVLSDGRNLHISLAPSGPRKVVNISLQAAINNIFADAYGFSAFTIYSSTLQLASWTFPTFVLMKSYGLPIFWFLYQTTKEVILLQAREGCFVVKCRFSLLGTIAFLLSSSQYIRQESDMLLHHTRKP
jgi:hypothetical protein